MPSKPQIDNYELFNSFTVSQLDNFVKSGFIKTWPKTTDGDWYPDGGSPWERLANPGLNPQISFGKSAKKETPFVGPFPTSYNFVRCSGSKDQFFASPSIVNAVTDDRWSKPPSLHDHTTVIKKTNAGIMINAKPDIVMPIAIKYLARIMEMNQNPNPMPEYHFYHEYLEWNPEWVAPYILYDKKMEFGIRLVTSGRKTILVGIFSHHELYAWKGTGRSADFLEPEVSKVIQHWSWNLLQLYMTFDNDIWNASNMVPVFPVTVSAYPQNSYNKFTDDPKYHSKGYISIQTEYSKYPCFPIPPKLAYSRITDCQLFNGYENLFPDSHCMGKFTFTRVEQLNELLDIYYKSKRTTTLRGGRIIDLYECLKDCNCIEDFSNIEDCLAHEVSIIRKIEPRGYRGDFNVQTNSLSHLAENPNKKGTNLITPYIESESRCEGNDRFYIAGKTVRRGWFHWGNQARTLEMAFKVVKKALEDAKQPFRSERHRDKYVICYRYCGEWKSIALKNYHTETGPNTPFHVWKMSSHHDGAKLYEKRSVSFGKNDEMASLLSATLCLIDGIEFHSGSSTKYFTDEERENDKNHETHLTTNDLWDRVVKALCGVTQSDILLGFYGLEVAIDQVYDEHDSDYHTILFKGGSDGIGDIKAPIVIAKSVHQPKPEEEGSGSETETKPEEEGSGSETEKKPEEEGSGSESKQLKFDELVEDDFVRIARSVAGSVISGKCKGKALVNCSYPEMICLDPICVPEYKHMTFTIGKDEKELMVMIGKD